MKASEWNKKYPEGTQVMLTDDHGNEHLTITRSIAWELGHGAAVVSVVGRAGGYSLDRVRAIQTKEAQAS